MDAGSGEWSWSWYLRLGVDPAWGACGLPWPSGAQLAPVALQPAHTPGLGDTVPSRYAGKVCHELWTSEGEGEGEDGEGKSIQHRSPDIVHRSQFAAACGLSRFQNK